MEPLKTPKIRATSSGAPFEANAPWPEDLSCWTGTSALVHLSLESTERIRANLPRTLFTLPGMEAYSPASLAALLTYCYATGIYDSEEIHFRLTWDPALRLLSGNRVPQAVIFLRFRRRFRNVLAEALTGLLRVAWTRHTEIRAPDCSSLGLASWNEFNLDPRCAREAEMRIARAMKADCAALDA